MQERTDRNTGEKDESSRDKHGGFMNEKEKSAHSSAGSEAGRDKTLERSGLSSDEERDRYIKSEPDTDRLRSEGQSVIDAKDDENK